MCDFSRHRLNGKRTFHSPQPDSTAVSKSSEGRFGAGEVTIESNRGGAGYRLTLTVTGAATFKSFKRSVPTVSLARAVPRQPEARSRYTSSYAMLASLRRCGLLSRKCVLPLSNSPSSTCCLSRFSNSLRAQLSRQLSRFIVGRLPAGHPERPPTDFLPKPETDESIVISLAIRRSGRPPLADVPPLCGSLPLSGERRPSVYPVRLFERRFCFPDRV